MKKEIREAVCDEALHLEAYRFEGLVQPFPNHFHEYYVIGYIEEGERALSCRNQTYTVRKGDLLLFGPGDSHACTQSGGTALSYRSLNLSEAVMLELAEEVTGRRVPPVFSRNVTTGEEAACCFCTLHRQIMEGYTGFDKEENLLLLVSLLLRRYCQPFSGSPPADGDGLERACAFMEQHYAEHISLEQICRSSGFSKSALLRAFTRSKGVTPYRYLETVRIGKAKKLLEQGVPPVAAAQRTGFSDQSHFTGYFSRFIGLTPGAYQEIFKEGKTDGFTK